jgi:uncharacterized protein (DUF1499 family)
MASRTGAGRVFAVLALILSGLAVTLVLVAGPGTRFGGWSFQTGLGLLRWVAYAAFAGIALSVVGLLLGGARSWAAVALVLGLGSAAVPLGFQRRAQSVPRIHDISTDTDDPPAFVAVVPRRTGALNPVEYGGPEIAAQQHQAYPDIRSVVQKEPPARAFDRALDAARGLGWEIVGVAPAEGRIEATDTTFWFGFKDDVVVRIRPEGSRSRIDVRSLSRVGRSDVGANARRIRRFVERLEG